MIHSVVTIIVSKSKCNFFYKIVGDGNRNIFPVGTIFYDFNAFCEQHLNSIFSIHAIRTAHDYFIIATHTLHFCTKNILSHALVIRDCYYLPPLSQLRYLFTNKLSASGIVVLCSDQKFINAGHEKIDIKIDIAIF